MAGGLEVRIVSSEITRLAGQFQAEGRRDLSRQMGAALDRVVPPVQAAIRTSAAETMPSGYVFTLTRSLQWRNTRRAGAQRATLRLVTYADGRSEKRDIGRLEKGELRHPLYGRRAARWYVTSIRPGFHERGTDKAADQVVEQLDLVVREFTRRLIS